MVNSRFLTSLLVAAATAPAYAEVIISGVVETFQWRDPFGRYSTPPGFEATCEAKVKFRATQHVVEDINEPPPVGLAPWADAIPYFFGGRPYPGSWDGVDNRGGARDVIMMEYSDVPQAVKDWIEEQQKDKEGDNRYLFAIYEKPKTEGDKIRGTAKAKETGDGAVEDKDKVLMFAAGALYDVLPLWVAKDSGCQDELMDLKNYVAWPEDNKVVAWPVEKTSPNRAEGKTEIEFTVKAQVLRETEEGRQARLQREKEEEEERLRQEEEARKMEEQEAANKKAEEDGAQSGDDGSREDSPGGPTDTGETGETAGTASSDGTGSESAGGVEKDEL